MTLGAEIEPKPHWWKASALTTWPTLPPDNNNSDDNNNNSDDNDNSNDNNNNDNDYNNNDSDNDSPLGYYCLVVVKRLAHLDDPDSYAGGSKGKILQSCPTGFH